MTGLPKLLTFSFFLVFVFLFCILSKAQNPINEYSYLECDNSNLIQLPLNTIENNSISQTVFYDHQDQFSYWYKIKLNQEGSFRVTTSPINETDEYTMFVYKSGKSNFCNKVFMGKITPLKSNRFLNIDEEKKNLTLTDIRLSSDKEATYYLCVLNISPSNCGHNMRLVHERDTMRVKAIHFPCVEPEEEVNEADFSKTSFNKVAKNYYNATIKIKDELDSIKKIDTELIIRDELTGNKIEIDFSKQNTFNLKIEEGKAYKVECLSMGYKRFDHSIVISDYMQSDQSDFVIFLKPLKKGDKFKMEHIYFYPNTYALKKSAYKEIDYLYNLLENNPNLNIELEGHTNGNNRVRKNRAYKKKGEEWNFEGTMKKLSVHRAEAIKKYLTEKGIDANRLSTKGYGGDRMIIPNAKTMEEIQKNVRVEVLLL